MTALTPTTPRQPDAESRLHLKNPYPPLAKAIREAGLLGRTRAYYFSLLGVLTALTAGLGVGFVLLGDSWFQLLIAAGLGVMLTQFAFVGHEALHHQVFGPGKGNDVLGRTLANGVVGISQSWWTAKHGAHHANPNKVGKDPDIDFEAIAFTEEAAAAKRGFMAALARRQGYAFFPLLLLEGLNLHITSIRTLLASPRGSERTWDLMIIAARLSLYVAVLFWFLPVGLAFAFLGVQLGVFGVYMGASFAPNHKGMPIISAESRMDFLRRQVLTSRNIRGGWFMSHLMGGLNYQIEHHLFPTMPRPHLARASAMVREYCAAHKVPYTETGLIASYGIVVRYLNRVGLAARDPFDCPARRAMSS